MTEETPTETPPVEEVKQPRKKDGTFAPKPKVEPLYSKREPESTEKTGTFSQTLSGYRDLLVENLPDGIQLSENFEKKSLRSQISILEEMRSAVKPLTDEPKAQPLDKTAKAEVGGEVPAPTTVHVPSLLEKNRADIFIREARAKTGYGQFRDKWKQAKDKK